MYADDTSDFAGFENHHRVADNGGEIQETVNGLGTGGCLLTSYIVDGRIRFGWSALLALNFVKDILHINNYCHFDADFFIHHAQSFILHGSSIPMVMGETSFLSNFVLKERHDTRPLCLGDHQWMEGWARTFDLTPEKVIHAAFGSSFVSREEKPRARCYQLGFVRRAKFYGHIESPSVIRNVLFSGTCCCIGRAQSQK